MSGGLKHRGDARDKQPSCLKMPSSLKNCMDCYYSTSADTHTFDWPKEKAFGEPG